ncbi:hypothetical protein GS3922_07245 [Geobacillus subterraneus]|uniref:Na+/H+ antiporter NhaC-like C-terminal domain-containing protein n=1 Tax=Geobacillus subterraneus TaxID=129338 RepID=A0ABN4NFT5_9BACL|nr:hypothetical protein GS3922_07245 [Geobacillus subterraneus]KZS26510.1 hypothetical protein A5418_10850 [Geobacillus subterraneus]
MEPSWKALLPFLVVIPISIWTKQVITGLFVGLFVGSYLMPPSLLGGLRTVLHYVVDNLMQTNNIRIIIFLYRIFLYRAPVRCYVVSFSLAMLPSSPLSMVN